MRERLTERLLLFGGETGERIAEARRSDAQHSARAISGDLLESAEQVAHVLRDARRRRAVRLAIEARHVEYAAQRRPRAQCRRLLNESRAQLIGVRFEGLLHRLHQRLLAFRESLVRLVARLTSRVCSHVSRRGFRDGDCRQARRYFPLEQQWDLCINQSSKLNNTLCLTREPIQL